MTVEIKPVKISSKAKPEKIERIPLFYIDDKEYTAPARITTKQGLRAARIMVKRGPQVAMTWLLHEAVGETAIDDLINCAGAHGEQIKEIFNNLSLLYYGQMEEMAGN